MNYLTGCNYWASHAGPEMWVNWDEETVRKDLAKLAFHGLRTLRVFPNWRDFQPLTPHRGQKGKHLGYLEEKQDPWYLDEVMLDRFAALLDMCHDRKIRCIVGLLTGWMSGRLFAPTALLDKNLFTDPTALLFEQRFVTGMVKRFRNHPAIYAWDLGNECNCMSECEDRDAAANWTGLIANAIRAADPTRPIISGMHGLTADGTWTIADQGEFCDVLTTHPYPLWCRHTYHDETLSFRTLNHAACETKLYADLSGKPCMMEEIGTMGPMICSDEAAAGFVRLNLFSGWANGSAGLLWWCANEQTNLRTPPFTASMVERELGLFYADGSPKPVVRELQRFEAFLKTAPQLPQAEEDAVCILTRDTDQWGIAYMTWCLAKQAGLNLRFHWCEDPLPISGRYLLPSIRGCDVLPLAQYQALQQMVKNGSELYISSDGGILSGFESLCGLKVTDSALRPEEGTLHIEDTHIPYRRSTTYRVTPTTAQVYAFDDRGEPIICDHALGQGKVYYVNFPLEAMLLSEHDAFDKDYYKVYRCLLGGRQKDPRLALTVHPIEADEEYLVYVNHSGETLSAELPKDTTVLYGDPKAIGPFDACIALHKYPHDPAAKNGCGPRAGRGDS